ncbi:MAG: DUF4397 domain-containing protein [Terriglobales bacterium]
MFRMLKILPLLLALGTLGVFTTSCGTGHSKVRLVHASPDAPNVDVAVDGKTVVTDLAFGGVSPASDYLTVTAGTRKVEVRTTGTTTDLINSNVSFGSQKAYTVLASGFLANIAAIVLTDDNSAPANGNFKLRIVHVSPSGPASVDVYVVPPGTDITGVTPTISSLAYGQASGYQTAAAASTEVIITAAGNKTAIIDQTYNLTAGQVRTLVVLDNAPGGSVNPIPLELPDLN